MTYKFSFCQIHYCNYGYGKFIILEVANAFKLCMTLGSPEREAILTDNNTFQCRPV